MLHLFAIEAALLGAIGGLAGVGLGIALSDHLLVRASASVSALYLRAPRLFDELSLCHADGSFRKRLAIIAKIDVLVIDDFAIAPMGPRERTDLLELLDDRVGARSTVMTSQLPIDDWHDYIGEATLADAIMDRLLHNARRLVLNGESMRR